ncbi:tRNA (N(6)-L-threonylcarbamoyladenosine(37)-C(2))-methylthiotransferase MtaB [Thermopetrobacter sp. TC1]|uniref:tRNA (N(6)-L-threonylcarbamoyladenosine(37)-C(2))- methylthiotransferase MtaB n=1 Tax=Thermopetrobacter sp. TC1 TaxID=1495045 RepID=UPI000571E972|nr:tRNA (N(6)-L-threonylcarbamoyladenosine(37)-C(2))-methylthiotransferase MtaB [Thermopetrobacter sp. TC1]
MNAPHIITFGCRLNAFESEAMRRHAEAAGLSNAVIVNTCAVTAEAQRQARQAIRKARRSHPERPLIVTGCAAQTDGAAFAAMPETDAVLGNVEKLNAKAWRRLAQALSHAECSPPGDEPAPAVVETEKPVMISDIMAARRLAPLPVAGMSGRTRAFVQVQNGCNHRCTFCIIPFGRGNARSLPMEDVIAQVRAARNAGHREVVLTGVDLTSWGEDLPGQARLGDLVAAVLKAVPELERLRISSIDVAEIDETFLNVLAQEERLMPHLHLSLQAGDDMILKRMKRRHSRAQAVDFCARVRALRPDVVFGADLIAGFPTETEEMFANTLQLVEDCGLVWLHVFPFSPRPGTPAARMPQVPAATARARAQTLRAAGEQQKRALFDSLLGETMRVLVERPGLARAENHAEVMVPEALPVGEIVRVRITGHDGMRLNGVAA